MKRIGEVAAFAVVTVCYVLFWMSVSPGEEGLQRLLLLTAVSASAISAYFVYSSPKLRGWDAKLPMRGLVLGLSTGLATALLSYVAFCFVMYFMMGKEFSLLKVFPRYAEKILQALLRGPTVAVFPLVYGSAGAIVAWLKSRT